MKRRALYSQTMFSRVLQHFGTLVMIGIVLMVIGFSHPAQALTLHTYYGGVADGFGNGTESPNPSSGAQLFVKNNYAYDEIRDYDDFRIDRQFVDSFSFGEGNIIGATVEIRVLSQGGGASNDGISFEFFDSSGVTDSNNYWHSRFSSLGVQVGQKHTLSFDLGNLYDTGHPANNMNLLSALNTYKFLDVRVQDDTAVDYIKLDVTYDPVPEPGTMSLLGMGVLGLFWMKKRKHARRAS